MSSHRDDTPKQSPLKKLEREHSAESAGHQLHMPTLSDVLVHSQEERNLFQDALDSRPLPQERVQIYSDSDLEEGMPLTQGVTRSKNASPDELADTVDPTGEESILSSSSDDGSGDEGSQGSGAPAATEVAASQASLPVQIALNSEAIKRVWKAESMRIPVPELLKWIAKNSDFIVGVTPSESRKPRAALSASALLPEMDTPEPFVGLNSSVGIVNNMAANAEKFAAHRPASLRSLVGKYAPPRDFFGASIGTYRLCDETITVDTLRGASEGVDFLSPIKTNYHSVVREGDLLRLEELARKSLLVLSNLDATVTALTRTYPDQQQPDPLFMRALYRCIQGLQVLTDVSSASLHQVVTHRRDTAINGRLNNQKHPVVISEDHLAQLRNGPCLGAKDLFDSELVSKVQGERSAKKTEDLQSVALNRLASSQQQQFKRSHSATATASTSGESKSKKRKGSGQQQPQQQRVVPVQAALQSPSAQAGQGSSNR